MFIRCILFKHRHILNAITTDHRYGVQKSSIVPEPVSILRSFLVCVVIFLTPHVTCAMKHRFVSAVPPTSAFRSWRNFGWQFSRQRHKVPCYWRYCSALVFAGWESCWSAEFYVFQKLSDSKTRASSHYRSFTYVSMWCGTFRRKLRKEKPLRGTRSFLSVVWGRLKIPCVSQPHS